MYNNTVPALKRQSICFVIVYIGELKYYERLFPKLESEFDIHLLFIRPDDERRQQAVAYAKENGYRFSILEYRLGGKSGKKTIPFLTALLAYYRHMRACQIFLKEHEIVRLIGPKASLPMRTLFKEANFSGIETVVIQRGHVPPSDRYGNTRKGLPFTVRIYAIVIEWLRFIVNFFSRGSRYAFTSFQPRRVGAIGKEGKSVLPARFGYDPERIEVLGSVEHQQIIELKQKMKNDQTFRKNLATKYHIDSRKKQILIVSARWHHYIDAKVSYTKEEEIDLVAYFDDVIRMIREVYPTKEADIHFKLHPAETDIYESYKKYGVIMHGNEAKIDELVSLVDLYISYPVTSANYMAVASGIDALFINFSPLQVLNRSAPDFDITHVIIDKDEFRTSLEAVKSGTLPKQYDDSDIKTHAIDNTIAFIRGNYAQKT